MRNASLTARLVLAAAAVAGLLVFVVIVDFGLNAGVVHRGVTVDGLDIGGLTYEEAQVALDEHRSTLRGQQLCFYAPEFEDCIGPDEVGWFPDHSAIEATARVSFDVGRTGGPVEALSERMQAWLGDIDIDWAAGPRHVLVTRVLEEWEQELDRYGYSLDRRKMRVKIKRSIVLHPPRPMRFAVEQS